MSRPLRNAQIEIFRFVFALGIVLFHCANVAQAQGKVNWFLPFSARGYLAVEFFFIVSGCLLAQKAFRTASGEYGDLASASFLYVWRKFIRIFPHALASIVVCLAIKVFFGEVSVGKAIGSFLLGIGELLGLQITGLSVGSNVLSLWFVSALLVVSYLLYPLVLAKGRTFSCIVAPLVSIFIYGWFCRERVGIGGNATYWNGFCYMTALRAIAAMCLGVSCHEVAEYVRAHAFARSRKLVLTIVALGSMSVGLWLVLFGCAGRTTAYVPFLFATGVALMFGLDIPPRIGFWAGSCRYLGGLSLTIYMYHPCFLGLFRRLCPPVDTRSYWMFATAVFVSTFVFACLLERMSAWRRKAQMGAMVHAE